MAVAEDASTPVVARSAAAWTTTTLLTTSFTPPANSLLIITANTCWSAAWTTAPTLSVSASAGGTPTQLYQAGDTVSKFDVAGSWYLWLGSAPGAITVTLTRSDANTASGQLGVRVLTGTAQSPSLLLGNVYNGTSATVGAQASVTPGFVGSQLYVATQIDRTAATLTPVAGTTALDNWQNSSVGVNEAMGKSTSLTASTSAQTIGFTPATFGSADDSTLQIIEVPPAIPASPAPLRAVQRAARIRSAHF